MADTITAADRAAREVAAARARASCVNCIAELVRNSPKHVGDADPMAKLGGFGYCRFTQRANSEAYEDVVLAACVKCSEDHKACLRLDGEALEEFMDLFEEVGDNLLRYNDMMRLLHILRLDHRKRGKGPSKKRKAEHDLGHDLGAAVHPGCHDLSSAHAGPLGRTSNPGKNSHVSVPGGGPALLTPSIPVGEDAGAPGSEGPHADTGPLTPSTDPRATTNGEPFSGPLSMAQWTPQQQQQQWQWQLQQQWQWQLQQHQQQQPDPADVSSKRARHSSPVPRSAAAPPAPCLSSHGYNGHDVCAEPQMSTPSATPGLSPPGLDILAGQFHDLSNIHNQPAYVQPSLPPDFLWPPYAPGPDDFLFQPSS